MLIDSHCHIQHCFTDRSDFDRGVKLISSSMLYIVDISTNAREFLNMKNRQLPSNILLSFGLYPEEAPSFNQEKGLEFSTFIAERKVKAVGECGIDYYRNYGTHFQQETLFRKQIETSMDYDLPLIVHTRNAFEDTYRILSSYKFSRNVIIHCFGYSATEAGKFLAEGYYLSFAGNVTYPGAKGIRDAVLTVPTDRLLIETDSPYLPPVPLRGQRNNPLNVKYTYKFISELRKTAQEELENSIESNFKKVFGL